MIAQGQDKILADKKRAILIKNAYLGLEKVENCHRIKSQRMKDQVVLRSLMKQYDRERYVVSLKTYRSQQYLRSRLGNMIEKSELDLTRASGDKETFKTLLENSKEKPFQEISGPSVVEELLFRQVLDSRREGLIEMRKPVNYSKRNDRKSFWEEDEEFYKSFGGAIRNPFQMIDSLMKQSAGEESTTPPTQPLYEHKTFTGRSKSLSAVEKMSFTKQKHLDVKFRQKRGKSAAAAAVAAENEHFKSVVKDHEKTIQEFRKDLEGKQKDLYHKVDKLILNKEPNQSAKVMAALAKYERSHDQAVEKASRVLPHIVTTLDSANMSIKTKKEWNKLFRTSQTPSLTWKPITTNLEFL